MELRRAILLFSIVLGLAAVAAAVSNPADDPREDERTSPRGSSSTPTARPQPSGLRVEIEFDAAAGSGVRTLDAGRAATVTVETRRPGLVAIGDTGITADADARTPAQFDVLFDAPARYHVLFTPAGATEPRRVGLLRVERLTGSGGRP